MKKIKYLYLVQGISYILFFYLSDGLLYYNEESQSYNFVNSLYSSGSDDNVAVLIGGFVCLLAFLILLRQYSYGKLVLIVSITFLLQMFSIFLIEVGSITETIFHQKDIYLLIGLLAQLIIIIIVAKNGLRPFKK